MQLEDIKRSPGRKDLLVFGLTLPVIFAILGSAWHHALWWVGAVVTLLYALVPPLRRPLYVAWMHAVFPIGWTISHAIMAVLYYGLITPMALVMRLLGRDTMNRRFDPAIGSYWSHRPPPPPLERYFRQY